MEQQNQKVLFPRWNRKIGREKNKLNQQSYLQLFFFFLNKEMNFYKDEATEGLSSTAKTYMVESLHMC